MKIKFFDNYGKSVELKNDLLRGRDGNVRAARRLKIEPSICKDRYNDCIQ